MRNVLKKAKIGVLIFVAALVVAQAFRIEKTNPPVKSGALADPAIKPLLKRACYDCHSNETIWPWYSNVAPVSWLVGSDVNEGRTKLNFSEWESYTHAAQALKLTSIIKAMKNGEMPPWYYSMMHRDSRLNQQERDQIKAWATAEFEKGEGPEPVQIAERLKSASRGAR